VIEISEHWVEVLCPRSGKMCAFWDEAKGECRLEELYKYPIYLWFECEKGVKIIPKESPWVE